MDCQQFNLSPMVVGIIFFLLSGTYTICAPIWGYLADKQMKYAYEMMIAASVLSSLSLLFIGPSPLLGLDKFVFRNRVSPSVFSQRTMGNFGRPVHAGHCHRRPVHSNV
jgi:MFS family permease